MSTEKKLPTILRRVRYFFLTSNDVDVDTATDASLSALLISDLTYNGIPFADTEVATLLQAYYDHMIIPKNAPYHQSWNEQQRKLANTELLSVSLSSLKLNSTEEENEEDDDDDDNSPFTKKNCVGCKHCPVDCRLKYQSKNRAHPSRIGTHFECPCHLDPTFKPPPFDHHLLPPDIHHHLSTAAHVLFASH